MRNLKRALSLTLASVMLLGMMVVGSSAAGFPDVDENDNIEAIEVLQAVKVMVGDDNGNFGPDDQVNRAQMAVVMALLLDLDYDYYQGSDPGFWDVPSWAAPYVAACYANGIVSGYGNGQYGSGDPVTAVQAASMMMRALGYFKYQSDYASGFELATVTQASKIELFKNVNAASNTTALTRNQVAQMALNALKTPIVEPDDNTLNITTSAGSATTTVTGGRVNYTVVSSTQAFARAIDDTERSTNDLAGRGGYTVELGEKLYSGDLKLYDDRTDDFGRPARHWEYKGDAIGTYMKKELLRQEYTTEVTGKDLYDLLGSDTIRDYTFDVTIDGVDIDGKTGSTDHNTVLKATGAGEANSYFDETYMTKTYKSGVGKTGKGVLTQVFVNPDDKHVDVAVINTYLAKATADYSAKKDEASFDVYALTSTGSGNNEVFYKYPDACKNDTTAQTKKLTVSSDDFAVEDVKKDDIVLVTMANGTIKSITEPEVLAGTTLTAFSKDSYVVTEGTQYDYNTTIDYDPEVLDDYTSISATQQLKDTEYNLFLDPYGYLIGVEVVDAVKNYIFLTGIDLGTSNLKNKTADAAGILMDGTFVEFRVDMDNSEAYWTHGGKTYADNNGGISTGKFNAGPLWNTWCTYTVDKDGVYTLKEVKNLANVTGGDKAKAGQYHDANYSGKDIDDKHVSLKSSSGSTYVYGNDNSIYIVAELDTIASDTVVSAGTVDMPDNTVNAEVSAKEDVGIISGVDSIATGITNVNLKTWTAAQIKAEVGNLDAYSGNVYTLFDKDGYVIAAVVVGEDDGSTKNLVYSNNDKISKESYDKSNDEWTWERKVISNGEEITLTEVGSDISVLKSLKENVWYEITYKADGTVKSAEYAYYTEYGKLIGATASTGSTTPKGPALEITTGNAAASARDFVDKVEWVENAINESNKTTVLYEEVWGKLADSAGTENTDSTGSTPKAKMTEAPSLKGSTLYVDTAASKGFYVDSNVKSVLIQKNDGKKTTTYGSGTSDLEGILDDLNYDDTNGYRFKISAILTGGHAIVVIIHDWNETGATTSGDRNPGSSTNTTAVVTVTGNTVNVTKNTETDMTVIAEEISKKLEEAGYTDVVVTLDGDDITSITGMKGNTKVTFKQTGDIAIVSPAVAVETAKTAVAAIGTDDDLFSAKATPDNAAAIKAAVEAAVKAAVTGGVDVSFDWDSTGMGATAAVNGTGSDGTQDASTAGTGTDGEAKVKVVLSKGDAAQTVELTLTVPAMAYDDNWALKAGDIEDAVSDALDAVSPSAGDNETTVQGAVNTAVSTLLGKATTNNVSFGTWKDAVDEEDTDSDGVADNTGVNGELPVTITFTVGSGTDAVTKTINYTVEIPFATV